MKDPLTIVNGTERTVWYPRRMDLPALDGEHEANAGPGQGYRISAKPEPEKLEPGTWLDLIAVFGSPLVILAICGAVWWYWMP